ncbi:type I restriction enzyme, S subunit [Fibrobacter sp. UWB15]|uniref:restriction endonuclease subunit S n=1 Tax=unclassified Fibrobacter TaxID=2634177 RepID=UPI00091D7677|nr:MULTISPECIES: restriction endonuclease subunit S [unclassified Fibrobacter]PWJ65111.1 type I restriction enzyme S subunit [Fibrobacter sp. UWB6]SHG08817.1 type I restriction enzyme, S subunit [Fibrobacter sp. UWB8]SMG30853.1 type I restriction enzyme, S subunit [Fibrobacter sp. UWB15]
MSKWEWKEFEDCIERVKYTTKIPSKDYLQEGEFPIVSQEDCLISGYWNDRIDLFKVTKPIVIFGDHTKVLKYIDFDFVLGADGVKILCPKDYLNAHFFFYFLKSVNFDNLGYARHYRLLKELSVPIPPLSEQKRIVKFLDEEFSKIETLKTNAETNLKNAKELFETTLEKELNPLSRHSERSEESCAELPSGWEWKKMRDVCDVRDGTHDSPKYHKEGYPLVTSKNLKNGLIDVDNVKYISKEDYEAINKRSKVCVGDILFAMIGTIGNAVLVSEEPCYAIKNVALFKKSTLINPKFLQYILNSSFILEKMQQEAKGTTQRFVGLDYLRSFQIPLPPLSVQKEIVARLDKLSENVKRLEANYKQIIANCDELKKTILKQTFQGGN